MQNTIDDKKEMTTDRIIELWKMGLTVQQISKKYAKNQKAKKINIRIDEAQQYIEPIIFDYQTNLLKS